MFNMKDGPARIRTGGLLDFEKRFFRHNRLHRLRQRVVITARPQVREIDTNLHFHPNTNNKAYIPL